MRKLHFIIASLCLTAYVALAQNYLPENFTDKLERAKMTFEMPEGFTQVDVIDNPHMKYDYAIRHDTADFEVWYAIRPMDHLIRAYEESLKDTSKKIVMINPSDDPAYALTDAMAVAHNISEVMSKPQPMNDTEAKNPIQCRQRSDLSYQNQGRVRQWL